MDSIYICRHLRKLFWVMYKSKGTKFYAKIREDGRYEFGCKSPEIKNIISEPIAIYLICGTIKY